jgi:hypothetical protein
LPLRSKVAASLIQSLSPAPLEKSFWGLKELSEDRHSTGTGEARTPQSDAPQFDLNHTPSEKSTGHPEKDGEESDVEDDEMDEEDEFSEAENLK